MSAETEISNIGMAPNSALEEMSTTDESMGANLDDQAESSWETPKLVTTASYPIVNSKPFNGQPEKIPLKVPGNVLTTTSVASAAAAAALASAAADAAAAAAAAAAAIKNNPNPIPMHIPTHANSDTNGILDKPYRCDTCEKAFSLRRALKAHKRVHTGEKPFKCDTCPKAFSHQGALKAHKRVHTGERPFKCDMCEMSFSHRSTLITHRRTHTGEKPFKCDLCDKVFSYRQTMKSHRKKHLVTANMPTATGMVMTSTASSTLGIASVAKRQLFECIYCGKDCSSRDELDAHIEETHLEKNPFRCFTCNKTFSNCDTLEKHKLTHLTPPVTKSGNLLAANNTDLSERSVSGANQDTNGDLSTNHFSSSSSPPSSSSSPSVSSQQQTQHHQQQQQQHHHLQQQQQQQQHQFPKKKTNNNNNSSNSSTLGTNRIHIEERPYKCCICNEGFPTITALTNHERTHNDDTSMSLLSSSLLSSYTCDICGVVFSEKCNLDAHKKMHVHEKPFDYKPITVTSQKDYADSPFECTICGALFSNNMWSSSA